MVYRIPTHTAPKPEYKPLYSLYEKNGRRWLRISDSSFYENTARMVFRNRILDAFQIGKQVDIREIEF